MDKYSNEHKLFLKKIKCENKLILLFRISIFIIFLFIWQFLSYKNIINTFLFSSPYNILITIYKLYINGNLLCNISITFMELLISFILSCFLGILIASIMWWNKFFCRIIEPYINIINSLPKVALGPLIIIWFGANYKSIIIMSLLISLFIIIINNYQSFISTNDNYIIMAKSFGASKWQIYKYIILPCNFSNIISTFKISISMNLIGVIMGELLISKKGLGYLIMYGSQIFNIDLVISCIFVLGIISVFLYYFISKKSR